MIRSASCLLNVSRRIQRWPISSTFGVNLSRFSLPCKLTSSISRHCFNWQAESESVNFSSTVDSQEPQNFSGCLASPALAPACVSNQIEASTESRIASRKPTTGLRTFRPLSPCVKLRDRNSDGAAFRTGTGRTKRAVGERFQRASCFHSVRPYWRARRRRMGSHSRDSRHRRLDKQRSYSARKHKAPPRVERFSRSEWVSD
jgi:hypothetical protein